MAFAPPPARSQPRQFYSSLHNEAFSRIDTYVVRAYSRKKKKPRPEAGKLRGHLGCYAGDVYDVAGDTRLRNHPHLGYSRMYALPVPSSSSSSARPQQRTFSRPRTAPLQRSSAGFRASQSISPSVQHSKQPIKNRYHGRCNGSRGNTFAQIEEVQHTPMYRRRNELMKIAQEEPVFRVNYEMLRS